MSATKRRNLTARSGLLSALVSRALARGLTLAFAVVLARAVEPSLFASYSYLLVLGAAVSLVTESGIAIVAGREVASGAHGVADVHRAGGPVVLATSLLAAALVVGVGLVDAGPGTSGWPLAWTAAFIAVNGWGNFQSELLRAAGVPWTEAGLQILAGILLVASGLAVLALDLGLAALTFALFAKQLVVVGLAQRWLPWPWRAAPAPRLTRQLLITGLSIGAAAACTGVVLRAPYLALANSGTDQSVAEYAIASRVLELTVMASQTAGFGLLPAMAHRAAAESMREMRRALAAGTVAAAVLTVPLVFAVAPVLPWLFGARYEGAVPAAQVLVAFTPAIVALYLAWYALVAERRERVVLAAAAVAVVIALAGAIVVLERPEPAVTAVATCVPLTVAALALCAALWRRPRGGRG